MLRMIISVDFYETKRTECLKIGLEFCVRQVRGPQIVQTFS